MIEQRSPDLRPALMDLVSTVIMYPKNALVAFAEWCRMHKGEIDALVTGGPHIWGNEALQRISVPATRLHPVKRHFDPDS